MSGWPHLPIELVQLIAQHLDSFDRRRFRSVCSPWRRSVPPGTRFLPSRFPIAEKDKTYLRKRAILRLGLPEHRRQDPRNDWLIKVEEDVPPRTNLFNLFSHYRLTGFPRAFPRILDLSDIRISELGHEYVLEDGNSNSKNKAAFASKPDGSYVVLTIRPLGKLAMRKSTDENWSEIDDFPSPYEDVILFGGRFYAVDGTGRAVIVESEPAPSVSFIAESVSGGHKKWLVESDGELLLVNIFHETVEVIEMFDLEDDDDEGHIFHQTTPVPAVRRQEAVRFKVYKSDQNGHEWVEVQSLGDQMLFLGDYSTFSASASGFSEFKGNRIYFTGSCFSLGSIGSTPFNGHGIGVFDLDDDRFCTRSRCRGYFDLFWPPPAWVTTLALEAGLDRLRI